MLKRPKADFMPFQFAVQTKKIRTTAAMLFFNPLYLGSNLLAKIEFSDAEDGEAGKK